MNFATLQGLTIPEGVVTQIADASGRVLWMLSGGKVILEVEKITDDTYAAETTYTDEQFILLDIYPKNANSTVKITYGGLTKSLTFNGANAQEVYFGTLYGVSDSMETPASGELIIEGGFVAFGCATYRYSSGKGSNLVCGCIQDVVDWGNSIEYIPSQAFMRCTDLARLVIPDGVKYIGSMACYNASNLTQVTIPASVTSIDSEAFQRLNGEHLYVTILATTPPTIPTDTAYDIFGRETDITITVPKGCGEVYKAADGWSRYANYIVEES